MRRRLVPSHDRWRSGRRRMERAQPGGLPLMQLCGDDLAGKRHPAAACDRLGPSAGAPRRDIPTAPADLGLLLRLWERELLLSQSALLLECDESDGADYRGLGDHCASASRFARRCCWRAANVGGCPTAPR